VAQVPAVVSVEVKGLSKLDKVISKASQLENIVANITRSPLEINVAKATNQLDSLDSELKGVYATIANSQRNLEKAGDSINSYASAIAEAQTRLSKLNPNTVRYNQVLKKQQDAIKGLAQAQRDLKTAESSIESSESQAKILANAVGNARRAKQAAEAINQLADDYLRLGAAQQRGVKGQILKQQLAPTISQLKAQADGLQLVASNSRIASSEFNRFAISSELASQKLFDARQKQLGALAFGLSGQAPKVNIGTGGESSIAGARNLVTSAIGSYGQITKSEAALSSYAERLRSLQSLVPYTSNEFRVLEEALAGVNQELSEIGLRGQKSAIQTLSGPATDLGSLRAFQLRESFQKKVNDQLNLQDSIQERISQATLFDFQKKKLTLQLDEAVAALAENRLGDAQRLTREIDRQRISMERMNRAAQKPQVFGTLGTAFLPVTGELPRGNVPGSPAAKVAEAKANRESTQAAVALAKQKQKAIEDEAEELRKGTQAATALGKQKLKALQDEAERLRQETSNAVALAQQKMREEERAVAQAWKMRGGPELPPSMGGGTAGVRGQAFRAGGPGAATAALSAPRRVESLVRSAQLAQEKLTELEIRGVDVTGEKASVQKIINSLKEKDLQISDQLLNNADDELNLIRDVLRLEKQRLTNQRLLGGGGASAKAGPTGTGLEQALKNLQEARGARQKFLGSASPAQAIDQIVREFNKGASGGGVGQVAENVTDTYASGIKAGIPAVAQAMTNLGKAGIDAIKKALGMASPSRVMLAIAKNQVDTYVDFLRAALPVVEAVAKSLGEAGAPNVSGVPESAIRKPITEKARTRPLTAEQLDRNSVIAEYAASQITGPMGQFEQVKRKIEDFIDKTRTTVDLDKLFGGQEDERFAMATRGKSAGPEFDKIRAALADFYQVPAELTPDLERGVKSASEASVSADELTKYVSELTSGIEQIGVLLQSAAKLPAPAVVVDNEFTRAQQAAAEADAAAAETARRKAEAQKPFEASIQRAAELDVEAKRKADAAVSSVVQAQIEADARAGAEAISKAILDPIESAAPEGERQVRSAIGNLFDRVAGALGFGGGGGGGRPPVPPTGGGGPTRDPRDFNRRLSTAAEQGAEALLGLQELRDPTKATTVELEALSSVLKEFRKILDPTAEGFERLEKQLRESAANLDRQVERRAPDAGFLTRRLGPRGARAASEGLIGGAFPLLFGQGLGATVGGGLGGALGGFAGGGLGFGLSLAGTAIGTAFDTATESAKSFVVALEDTGDATSALETAFGRIDKETKTLIGNLAESGQRAAAAEASFEALAEKVGTDQAQAFQRAGEAARNWGAGVQTQLTKLYANAVLLAETIARIFPQQQASVFDIVEAKPEQPITQEAQNRLEDLLGQNNLLEKQVALSKLTTAASVDQRLQLERQVALQDYVNDATELERQLKQNLLSQQEYNLRLKGAELNLTKQLYDLENAAAQERDNRARQARQEAERAAKERERAISSVLGLQSELMQVGLAGADIDVESARIRGGDVAAIEEELNQLQQRFNYEARILDLQLNQKLVSSDVSAQEKTLLESVYQQQLGNLKAQYDVRQATLQQAYAQLQLNKFIATEEAKRQAVDPFVQFRQTQQLDQQYAQAYHRLLTEGIAPAEARRLADFERLVSQQLKSLDIQVAIAQSTYDQAVALGIVGQELKNYADNLERAKGARDAAAANAALGAGLALQEIPGAKIQEFISTAEEELKDLEALAIRVSQSIGDAVGNSLANGISGLVEGTTTAKQVFADFLKEVGQILVSEGTRMIATYIAIGIAKIFAGLGGGSKAAKDFEMPGEAFIPRGGFKFPGAADGAYFASGVAAFANGGMFTNSVVSSPTLFKFADGGAMRTGVMGEAGPEAIMPLSRGSDGRLGVNANGLREAMSASGGSSSTPMLNMTFETTSINGVEYVSREQLETAMAATRRQAAKDGAKQGMNMTLDRLQQSPKTRSRVGLR
jgi:lambda family phage tail tape measure protein